MQAMELLISDNRGIYIPQDFATLFDLSLWSNIEESDIETISQGPDAEWYWDAWDSIVSMAQYKHGGHTWHLWQDGDLWAFCPELMTDEEYENFFGRQRNN